MELLALGWIGFVAFLMLFSQESKQVFLLATWGLLGLSVVLAVLKPLLF